MTDQPPLLKLLDDLPQMDRSKIDPDAKSGCWQWIAGCDDSGYGNVRRHGRVLKAHRYIYELYRGPINTNIHHLDHLCRNRKCVNPEHLEPATAQMNNWRGAAAIEGDLPRDLADQVYQLVQRSYKRGLLEGIRQAKAGRQT